MSPHQRRDSDRYCQLCNAWFNNPAMAQQHYGGKKHRKNAARAHLLEQLGNTLDLGQMRGTHGSTDRARARARSRARSRSRARAQSGSARADLRGSD